MSSTAKYNLSSDRRASKMLLPISLVILSLKKTLAELISTPTVTTGVGSTVGSYNWFNSDPALD